MDWQKLGDRIWNAGRYLLMILAFPMIGYFSHDSKEVWRQAVRRAVVGTCKNPSCEYHLKENFDICFEQNYHGARKDIKIDNDGFDKCWNEFIKQGPPPPDEMKSVP